MPDLLLALLPSRDHGAGEGAKLFNNTLMMMNPANIVDIIAVAPQVEIGPRRLVEVIKQGETPATLSNRSP